MQAANPTKSTFLRARKAVPRRDTPSPPPGARARGRALTQARSLAIVSAPPPLAHTAAAAEPAYIPYSIRSRAYASGWFDLTCFCALVLLLCLALFA
jgi:hypothetical protein